MNHSIRSVVEMNKLFKDVILCDVCELHDFLPESYFLFPCVILHDCSAHKGTKSTNNIL